MVEQSKRWCDAAIKLTYRAQTHAPANDVVANAVRSSVP